MTFQPAKHLPHLRPFEFRGPGLTWPRARWPHPKEGKWKSIAWSHPSVIGALDEGDDLSLKEFTRSVAETPSAPAPEVVIACET